MKQTYKQMFEGAVTASRSLAILDHLKINSVLNNLAAAVESHAGKILQANAEDLACKDTSDPMYDRLMLTQERIASIASDIRNVAALKSPVGESLGTFTREDGLRIEKVRVPFGVIGVIYEARPNVTLDVFTLCFKTGNAAVLKGGSDADKSNRAIVEIIKDTLEKEDVDTNAVTLLPPQRESADELMNAVGYVDVIIPRGSSGLINHVRDNSRIPVIETGAGICHTYVDAHADTIMAREIVFNAKTRRVSVCNALDCLIVHRDRLADLPAICLPLASKGVEILADEESYAALAKSEKAFQSPGITSDPSAVVPPYPASLLKSADESSFGTEFLGYRMSVKTVASPEEAIDHISRHSSRHSEAIVTRNEVTANLFAKTVDAACVYINASTAFTDGAQFGMRAEIGISTQKLHARGPMALPELTSYKYVVTGTGHTRG